MGFLNLEESFLGIKSGVLSKSTGNNEESVSKGLDTKLDLALNLGSSVLSQVLVSGDFEGTSTGKNSLVFNGVLDGSKTIADSLTGLGDRVIVGALNENSA